MRKFRYPSPTLKSLSVSICFVLFPAVSFFLLSLLFLNYIIAIHMQFAARIFYDWLISGVVVCEIFYDWLISAAGVRILRRNWLKTVLQPRMRFSNRRTLPNFLVKIIRCLRSWLRGTGIRLRLILTFVAEILNAWLASKWGSGEGGLSPGVKISRGLKLKLHPDL